VNFGIRVEQSNLTRHISELRRILGDDEQEYIRTVAGRGYKFAAKVSVTRLEQVAPAKRSGQLAEMLLAGGRGGSAADYLSRDQRLRRTSRALLTQFLGPSRRRGKPKQLLSPAGHSNGHRLALRAFRAGRRFGLELRPQKWAESVEIIFPSAPARSRPLPA
jgi:hypothetical protein